MPPSIVLLDADWPSRALLRAQLIEEGFDVAASDTWETAMSHIGLGHKPKLVIVDLRNLDDARAVLRDLRLVMDQRRVLVLTAAGTLPPGEVEALGFHALARPVAIDDVVAVAKRLVSSDA